MKKILCVLLSVCLLVGCLPLSAGAASTEKEEALRSFIKSINAWYGNYDAKTAAKPDRNGYHLLDNLIDDVGFRLFPARYPGETWPPIDFGSLGEWGNYPQCKVANERQLITGEEDPLGRWSGSRYFKASAQTYEWIMENVFNVMPSDISAMKRQLHHDSTYSPYEYNGFYYSKDGTYGSGKGSYTEIKEIIQKGNLYFVKSDLSDDSYSYYDSVTTYSIVEPKIADGVNYWSIHYNYVSTDSMVPTLPSYYNGGEWPTSSSTSPTPTPTPGLPAEDNALMNKAIEYGLLQYMDSQVDLTANTTRVDMACLLAGLANVDLSTVGDISDRFTDCGSLTSVQKAAVGWAFNNSILSGDNGRFRPYDRCSRAETALFFCNYLGNPSPNSYVNFSDVGTEEWYSGAVSSVARCGIFQEELKTGIFNPGKVLIYRDALRWLVHTYEYEHNISFTPLPPPDGTTTNPTTELTAVEKKELEDFLVSFAWFGDGNYDANNALSSYNVSGLNILECLVTPPRYHCYDDSIYPGTRANYCVEGSDPLNKFYGCFGCVMKDRTQWVLKNIFNVSDADIREMERMVLTRNPKTLYLYNGAYYFSDGGVGGGPMIQNVEAVPNGKFYNVTYELRNSYPSEWHTYHAVVERKTIDGKAYWTMHSNKSTDGDITPTPTPKPSIDLNGKPTVDGDYSDGCAYTTTTWPDGRKAVAEKVGNASIMVTASDRQVIANIYIPSDPGPGKWFSDVPSDAWYKRGVDSVTALGLFSGTGTNQFSPGSLMTRAMLVTVLHNLSGKAPYGVGYGSFNDVEQGSWYASATEWAQKTEVVKGKGSGFDPYGNITREEMVTMLYRYANLIGEYSGNLEYLSTFPDAWKVSSWARDAMDWAAAKGFVKGRGSEGIAPQAYATRAEVATILSRFTDYLMYHNFPKACYTCKRCGKTIEVTYVSRYGYCDACYDIELSRNCQICGKVIREIDCESHADYMEKWNLQLCSDCYYSHYCPTCQKVSTNVWEGYCDICDPSPRCKICGARGFGRGLIDGYCWDCYGGPVG